MCFVLIIITHVVDHGLAFLVIYSYLVAFQCIIDLKENVLIMGSTGKKTRFLDEKDLPECSRLVKSDDVDTDVDKAIAESIKDSGWKNTMSS